MALKPGGGGVSTVGVAEVGVGGKKVSSRAEVSGNAFYKLENELFNEKYEAINYLEVFSDKPCQEFYFGPQFSDITIL